MKPIRTNRAKVRRSIIVLALLASIMPLSAQNSAPQAAVMLQELNVQIVEASRRGDKERVQVLQNRFMEIQKKWNVQPAKPLKVEPPDRKHPLPPPETRPRQKVFVPQPEPPKPKVYPREEHEHQPSRSDRSSAGGDVSREEASAVALTNQQRKERGLLPLRIDDKLTAAARDHSNDMRTRDFFSHDSPVKGKASFDQRARNFGTTANAENIAKNPNGAADVMDRWMKSSGHRQNILTPDFKRIGIGKSGEYWTMMLGN